MRRIFIPSDLHEAGPLSKVKLARRFAIRCIPILVLGVCLPSPAQVIQSLPASEDLSTNVNSEKPYEQNLERFSGNIPLRPPARFGKVRPLVFPAETNLDNFQPESTRDGDTSSAQADSSAS